MTVHTLVTSGIRPALLAVAAHGLTDLDGWDWRQHYALWVLLPIPSSVVTPLFCMGSLVHFAEDVGPAGSAMVHALVLAFGLRYGKQASFRAMLAYLACVHVPSHYRRCWRRRRYRALALAGAGTLLALALRHHLPGDTVALGHLVQRIVISHIMHELSLADRFGDSD